MQSRHPPAVEDRNTLGKRKWSPFGLESANLPANLQQESRQDSEVFVQSSTSGYTPTSKKLRSLPKTNDAVQSKIGDSLPQVSGPYMQNLPPEILQYIFTFMDPASLGRLMCVNKAFSALLDPRKPLPQNSGSYKIVSVQPQDTIWETARKIWTPSAPQPMLHLSEYEMFKLVCNESCQFCMRRSDDLSIRHDSSPWIAGPGLQGVRTIWPFRVRSCGECLQKRLQKYNDVFLSSDSELLPGLSFACFTSSWHYVSSVSLRQTSISPDVQLTKFLYLPEVVNLRNEASEKRRYGSIAAEEWYKNLEKRGHAANTDTARLEQWELSGGLNSLATELAMLKNQIDQPADSMDHFHSGSLVSPVRTSTPRADRKPGWQMNASEEVSKFRFALAADQLPYMPLPHISPAPGQTESRAPASTSRVKQIKTPQEIERLKMEKRLDIERRCQDLRPPLLPDTLQHLDAFHAALQITLPLNENAWETLKERLLTQKRNLYLDLEAKSSKTAAPVHGVFHPPERSDEYIVAKSVRPKREKLDEIAKEYIKQCWQNGTMINSGNAPEFAAKVLQHVRHGFYELQEREASLSYHPNFKPVENVVLDLQDMKHVFDTCIKPYTEYVRKEVFLCNDCVLNGAKYFMFDSMIQHFASKHTKDFSREKSSVYWRARWPERPPFKPDPERFANAVPFVEQSSTLTHHPTSTSSASSTRKGETPKAGPPSSTTFSAISSWDLAHAPRTETVSQPSSSVAGRSENIYLLQCETLVSEAYYMWTQVSAVRYLPDNVRLYVIIHHVQRAFRKSFTNEPTLSLFKECVETKDELKALRSLVHLNCKACGRSAVSTDSYGKVSVTNYPLLELLSHFQMVHIERALTLSATHGENTPQVGRLDWKYDMIQLPRCEQLKQMANGPGLQQFIKDEINGAFVTALTAEDTSRSNALPQQLINIEHQRIRGLHNQQQLVQYNHQLSHQQLTRNPSEFASNATHDHNPRQLYLEHSDLHTVLRRPNAGWTRVPEPVYSEYALSPELAISQEHLLRRLIPIQEDAPYPDSSRREYDHPLYKSRDSSTLYQRQPVDPDNGIYHRPPSQSDTSIRRSLYAYPDRESPLTLAQDRIEADRFLDNFEVQLDQRSTTEAPHLSSKPERGKPLSTRSNSVDHDYTMGDGRPTLPDVAINYKQSIIPRQDLRFDAQGDSVMYDAPAATRTSTFSRNLRGAQHAAPSSAAGNYVSEPISYIYNDYRRHTVQPADGRHQDVSARPVTERFVRYVDEFGRPMDSRLLESRVYEEAEAYEGVSRPNFQTTDRRFYEDQHQPIRYLTSVAQSPYQSEPFLEEQRGQNYVEPTAGYRYLQVDHQYSESEEYDVQPDDLRQRIGRLPAPSSRARAAIPDYGPRVDDEAPYERR